jgi:hypothetical protein
MRKGILFFGVSVSCLIVLGGCNTVGDAAGGVQPQPIVHHDLSPGPMNVATSPFVGVFGEKTPVRGMQVKFSSTDNVTVNGMETTAMGTYTVDGNTARAVFPTTNKPNFQKTTFTIAKDGQSISFVGPKGTMVHLDRLKNNNF